MFLVQCKTGFKFTETKIEVYKRVAFGHFSVHRILSAMFYKHQMIHLQSTTRVELKKAPPWLLERLHE